jgi:hypothetical protein
MGVSVNVSTRPGSAALPAVVGKPFDFMLELKHGNDLLSMPYI